MASSLEGKTVAIVGANGQIGRTLCDAYATESVILRLFVRDPASLAELAQNENLRVFPYESFFNERYDVVVNTAGPGDPVMQRNLDSRIVETLDRLDLMVLDYLDGSNDVNYIYISTGAVYAGGYEKAADDASVLTLPVGRVDAVSMYPLAKLSAEARHRARGSARIADIRLFGYISERLDPNAGFFLSKVLNAIGEDTPFATNRSDFVRDFVGPTEMVDMIERIIDVGGGNDAFDIYSAAPLTKLELLEQLAEVYGLNVCFNEVIENALPMRKPSRVSLRRQSEGIGYIPKRTSLAVVIDELGKALARIQSGAEA